jgi:hypothetical protein
MPFFPTPVLNDRSKELRWADSDDEDIDCLLDGDSGGNIDGDSDLNIGVPSSYLDAVCHPPPPLDPSS